MSATYEPGTVAEVTDRHGRCGRGICNVKGGWDFTPQGAIRSCYSAAHEITDVRPLVVLDPRDWANSADLSDAADYLESNGWNGSAKVLRRIVEQTKPSHIPEPGLWGVVEATVEAHAPIRGRFVRDDLETWACLDWPGDYDWSYLIDPTLIREGVGS